MGLAYRSASGLAPAVAELLADLPAWRERARAHHNRALYEVPQILAGILHGARQGGPAVAPATHAEAL